MGLKSSTLMKMAEDGLIREGCVVKDQQGIEFVFTGKSFQPLDWKNRNKTLFYGLCVDDEWTITDKCIE